MVKKRQRTLTTKSSKKVEKVEKAVKLPRAHSVYLDKYVDVEYTGFNYIPSLGRSIVGMIFEYKVTIKAVNKSFKVKIIKNENEKFFTITSTNISDSSLRIGLYEDNDGFITGEEAIDYIKTFLYDRKDHIFINTRSFPLSPVSIEMKKTKIKK